VGAYILDLSCQGDGSHFCPRQFRRWSQAIVAPHWSNVAIKGIFLRCFWDPIRVPRISSRVTWIREDYHRVPRIWEIGSLQVHTGYLTFSLKKTDQRVTAWNDLWNYLNHSEFLKDKSEMMLVLLMTTGGKASVNYLADIFEKVCSLNKQLQ